MLTLVALVAASSFGISGQAEGREVKFRGALLAQANVNAPKAPMTLEAIDRELATLDAARPTLAPSIIFICLGATLALVGLPAAFIGLFGNLVLLVAGLVALPVGLVMLIGGIAGAVAVGHDRRVLGARRRELESMKQRPSEPPPAPLPPSVDSVMRPVGGLTLALF